ncbi:MAG: FtsX-like permease family protein [Bacteroidales bacterium]|nr:FtsX-like permease family protein [Bacteroidales bacterium]
MLAFKFAYKNLIGAGLRTWLNVSVLSFAFVVIVFYNGMLDGWNRQGRSDTVAWETGNGQYWHPLYDRYDPFSLQDAHAAITSEAEKLVKENQLTPMLITQATAYPQGRMLNVMLRGIDPNQKILLIPSASLNPQNGEIPALIGKRMAESAHLKKGDHVLIRWRDINGTFDAREVLIIDIFKSNVPTVDVNQVYIPLTTLQEMTGMKKEATLLVAAATLNNTGIKGWAFKDTKFLLKDFDEMINAKKGGSRILYLLLLSIALLAIFDTQVLSIFRRQKEIGTYIALGMTRAQVIRLFTVEGSAHSILALILGSLYGIPLMLFINNYGIPMPKSADQAGVAISEKIIPFYSFGMLVSTILLVVISATIVSYFPTRRISKMKPTDALKGKIQ